MIKRPPYNSLSLLALSSVIVAGCSVEAAPSCDDSVVQSLVAQIMQEQILNEAIQTYFLVADFNQLQIRTENELANIATYLEEAQKELRVATEIYAESGSEMDLWGQERAARRIEDLEKSLAEKQELKIELPLIYERATNATVDITGIRTQSVDDQVRKTTCLCQISLAFEHPYTAEAINANVTFDYVAQYSDDGENIYVEGNFM